MINGCWSRLERVSGHIRHIYRTGLSCKVDHLDCAMYANDVQKFRTVLHDALPWRLDLSIHLDLFPMDLSLGIFKDTLGITELRLFISFDEFYGLNDPLVDAEVAQDNLREVVAPLQLTALEVELDWKGATSNHDPEHRSLTALNSFRFRDFARQIMAVQSSLHSFALSITGTAAAKWEIDRSSPNYPLLVMCDMQHSEQVLIA
ncbi:hypothetical protein CERSUDRAFT_102022 [Gelatoporia subvermispora B]|uniref:Uncharacterized protein n=1 Tax=Ceriporiopsis subvermispora (strain B) TaxID=914234 RepID=M2QWU8_CERS8|nr:hypothetical protein CERSUDRAFT_102022 [Gelatoporia subvermispora B]